MSRGFRVGWFRVGGWILVASLWACGGASGDHCLAVPCPLPVAVHLSVTAAGGGAVSGATMAVSGAVSGGGPCAEGSAATTCDVLGGPGTYSLTVSAPGYQRATITVNVPGQRASGCGCALPETQDTTLVLARQG